MSPTYKRWYDHDPLLLEVIELLKNYQTELRAQAEIFLAKIEEKVIASFCLIDNLLHFSSLLFLLIFNLHKLYIPHSF